MRAILTHRKYFFLNQECRKSSIFVQGDFSGKNYFQAPFINIKKLFQAKSRNLTYVKFITFGLNREIIVGIRLESRVIAKEKYHPFPKNDLELEKKTRQSHFSVLYNNNRNQIFVKFNEIFEESTGQEQVKGHDTECFKRYIVG